MNSKKLSYIGLTTILVIFILVMSTAVASADDHAFSEIHVNEYYEVEVHIDEIHRTVAGYAHDDLGPSFYSNDWDTWPVGSWSDLTADEIAYLDTVIGLSASIWHYIDMST